MSKKIAILGSTGSIGTQALEVLDKIDDEFEVVAISAGRNINLVVEQVKKYQPKFVCVQDEIDAINLQQEFPHIEVLCGEDGLLQIADIEEIELILVAVSGRVGLKPTIKAIQNKKDIALANKETLVMAGDIVMNLAKENNVKILPVDSEHSAIFQCMQNRCDVKKLIITSSGGPFRNSTIEEMQTADMHEALNHPRWKMGKKITVDSATLMNKGLEVIEAHHLFDFDYEDIKVVVHPQSYIHSAIEYLDGSIIAQIGNPSMHIPIQYALTYPKRVEGIETESFDFIKAGKIEFFEPDDEKFPSLSLAIKAGMLGGTYPVCMNAANEEAVWAFLNKEINFLDIYKVTEQIFDSYVGLQNPTIDDIINEDEKVRVQTRELIKSMRAE